MKHKIGTDYTEVIAQAKTKRDLPLIGRLQRKIDIDSLKKEMGSLLEKYNTEEKDYFDPASSEHNYHLKNYSGDSFINNYEDFYSKYSIIGFQELSREAVDCAKKLDFGVESLTPHARLKGMKNTSIKNYHPYYDERNYNKKTPFCTGTIEQILDSFISEPSRSALVCLQPEQYISPHFDIGPEYITRIMIPIFTCPRAVIGFKKKDGSYLEYHLPADGGMYFINSGYEHYAINRGAKPRYQIRVCLNSQEDIQNVEEVECQRALSQSEFEREYSF